MVHTHLSDPAPGSRTATQSALSGITERLEHGTLILSPKHRAPHRRIVFVNSYGGASCWERIKTGSLAPHHLWGCLELVRLGYEVALCEPLSHFYFYRRPLPHDLKLLPLIRDWLGHDGILYCGHTLLYWVPLLRRLGVLKCKVVSLTYAREELHFGRLHDGIIALTPAATDQAARIAPRTKVAAVGWGVDLEFYPKLDYDPQWFLSCGIANRDFATLRGAAGLTRHPIRVICPGLTPQPWSANVTVFDGGRGWHTDQGKPIDVQELMANFYSHCFATLIIMQSDPEEYTANGFTNLMESMALGQPVIMSRTGALPGELDIEAAGCGLFVPPNDPAALAGAMDAIASDPARARAMGDRGRQLCEERYNLSRCADDLHAFFESL